ncbi:MAG TPA: type II toxin-antitoxin system PemK/MazF family toxin [Candidatus Competibacteraceae bacterium]|nr:type II toxin-antitoxin system PemK/MazF family toxin [Candidatus Competibacteraceae bacterium]HRZ07062.1 type II toxin-antitoxin system PemK/MazF family toxin [Candidatus Competibacteraceae bacterium]HSA44999.1 type II toxin-antitoxin system PemK/MazF family toxin [Candidatus Competibacteraceae bacterium]
MKRGDIVTVALSGDYGKPRPAVVIQSDWVDGTDSVLVCLFTSTLRDAPIFRLTVEPLPANGLKTVSQVMVDKIMAVRRDKCGPALGRLDDTAMWALNRLLALVVGIAD